jgi:4-hydroxybenzoate polyprenyltransferase
MQRFFALSRTTHGILDLAAPAFVAVLWLGGFPDLLTIGISILTAFAAYTAIYTLNDLVGVAVDREKFATGEIKDGYSVEASALRYPLAQDALSYRKGVLWFLGWFLLALVGAWLLNPVIVWILIAAAILEVIYCSLLKVTYWRFLFSGLVKASGPISAIFVVDRNPNLASILAIFGWVLFWEIGGQNVPADWNDTEEDLRVGAKTIPIRFGFKRAGQVVSLALSLTVAISLCLPLVSPLPLGLVYIAGSLLAGYFLLLQPAYKLYRSHEEGRLAARLFDRASYYPLAMLATISLVAVINILIQG